MPRPTTNTYLSYIYTYIIIFNDGQLKYIMSVLFFSPSDSYLCANNTGDIVCM